MITFTCGLARTRKISNLLVNRYITGKDADGGYGRRTLDGGRTRKDKKKNDVKKSKLIIEIVKL